MKKLLRATAVTALFAGAANAEDIKLGVVIGFTGPIESLTGSMAAAAEMAMAEVTASGKLLVVSIGCTVITLSARPRALSHARTFSP